MKSITSQYSEAIANVVPYLIIAVSLVFLTKMILKYVKMLLQEYD